MTILLARPILTELTKLRLKGFCGRNEIAQSMDLCEEASANGPIPGDRAAGDNQGSRDDEDGAATKFVSHARSEEGSHRAAQEHGGYVEAGAYVVSLERFLHAIDGAVDDSTVEAKQEATNGGYDGDEDDASEVGLFSHWVTSVLTGRT